LETTKIQLQNEVTA